MNSLKEQHRRTLRKFRNLIKYKKNLEISMIIKKEQIRRDNDFKELLEEKYPNIYKELKLISISRNYGYEKLKDMKKRIQRNYK